MNVSAKLVRAGIYFTVFALFSVGALLSVSQTISRPLTGDTQTYSGVFTDASGLQIGDDVEIAGVRVGRVSDEQLDRQGHAVIRFDVLTSQPVYVTTRAVIRYKDLLGARYLALVDDAQHGAKLPAGAVIPLSQTAPALDLTALFNGFKPLFAALTPADINHLSSQLVAVLQGETGQVGTLMTNLAGLVGHLAERANLLGQVIDNLSRLVTTAAGDAGGLRTLITSMRQLADNVAGDRMAIGDSLSGVDDLARSLSQVVSTAGPPLTTDVGQLNSVSGLLLDNSQALSDAVRGLGPAVALLNQSLDYGSWLNVYACSVTAAGGGVTIPFPGSNPGGC